MTPPWPTTPPTAAQRAAFADAVPRPYWLDDLPARDPHPRLERVVDADLCIVGGGFTGLWAALHAKRLEPARSVVLLEGGRCGEGASGRNGGFLDASLTHGLANGLSRFESEMATLERLGAENFAGLRADLDTHGMECEYELTGTLEVALERYQADSLHDDAELERRFGHDAVVLDADAVRAEVRSPTYLGGLWLRDTTALVHPGKLGDGLRRAAAAAGVQIFEHSPVHGLSTDGAGVRVSASAGAVRARRALLGTSAYPPLVHAVRRYIAPVYDYALMTEPLSDSEMAAIGWPHRQGIGDMSNQFHYYRLTADNRILFGGYDAVYRYGGPVADSLDDHTPTFATLSQHLFTTFPQLDGIRFTHRWGGAIDTCSRFSVFFGTALDGRVSYAVGYTGLGVGATRWGAQVALDLLDGRHTEATALRFVRRKPVPFPPEPARSAVIALTRNRLAAADRREGRRGVWLGALDRLGLGFDS
ncbi:MAG TPA: FAD-dependent oxidoreductase [Solirubrobacteraceae bacterium]|nr:FAD-dependent oxidoreductase [Solirubrobacteraceae bacterium]